LNLAGSTKCTVDLRYCTYARKTGGLADTVQPYNSKNGDGNGFLFEKYTTTDMLGAIKNAVKIFQATMKHGKPS